MIMELCIFDENVGGRTFVFQECLKMQLCGLGSSIHIRSI